MLLYGIGALSHIYAGIDSRCTKMLGNIGVVLLNGTAGIAGTYACANSSFLYSGIFQLYIIRIKILLVWLKSFLLCVLHRKNGKEKIQRSENEQKREGTLFPLL